MPQLLERYRAIRAVNENHDPDNGQFASGGGSSAGGGGAKKTGKPKAAPKPRQTKAPDIRIKTAEATVAKIQTKVDKARADVAKHTASLKLAKADLAKVKAEVKGKVSEATAGKSAARIEKLKPHEDRIARLFEGAGTENIPHIEQRGLGTISPAARKASEESQQKFDAALNSAFDGLQSGKPLIADIKRLLGRMGFKALNKPKGELLKYARQAIIDRRGSALRVQI